MSSSLRTEVFNAGGLIVLPETANFLMLIATASPVTVKFTRDGSFTEAAGVEAGYVKALVRPWDRVTLAGPPGGTVSFFLGYEEVSEDHTDYRRTVGVFQQELSSSLGNPPLDVDVGGVPGPVQLIGTNLARRKVTVGLLDTASTYVRVSSGTVTAGSGARLGGGQTYTYEGTGPVFAIRESAAAGLMWVQEELY